MSKALEFLEKVRKAQREFHKDRIELVKKVKFLNTYLQPRKSLTSYQMAKTGIPEQRLDFSLRKNW